MTKLGRSRRSDNAAGFSLIELLVVVGIIAVTAGTAVPSILAYLKNYAIEGAAQDVAREIQSARNRAIMRNTNLGVSLIIIDQPPARCFVIGPPAGARCYRFIMEDDVDPQSANPAENWFVYRSIDTLLTDAAYVDQLGPPRELPAGVLFDPTGATGRGVRFDRYGQWCDPGVDPGCTVHPAGGNYVANAANGAVITITQPSTLLQRVVRVATGGRVLIASN